MRLAWDATALQVGFFFVEWNQHTSSKLVMAESGTVLTGKSLERTQSLSASQTSSLPSLQIEYSPTIFNPWRHNVKLRGAALLRRPARTQGWASLFHAPMGKVAVTSMRAATTAARNAKSAAISEAEMSG